MAFVQLDGTGKIIGMFASAQNPPVPPGYAVIDDNDPRIAAFFNPPSQQLAAKLAAGIAITSTGTPALSATYALDPVTLDQIGSVARDAGAGLGLPGGAATFTYPDINGAPHAFTAAQIQALYKAMRDYVFAANQTAATLQAGGSASWPASAATIP